MWLPWLKQTKSACMGTTLVPMLATLTKVGSTLYGTQHISSVDAITFTALGACLSGRSLFSLRQIEFVRLTSVGHDTRINHCVFVGSASLDQEVLVSSAGVLPDLPTPNMRPLIVFAKLGNLSEDLAEHVFSFPWVTISFASNLKNEKISVCSLR